MTVDVSKIPMGAKDETLKLATLVPGELVVLRWDLTKHKLARWVQLRQSSDSCLVQVQRVNAKGEPVPDQFGKARDMHCAHVVGRANDRRWQKLPDELREAKPKPSAARAEVSQGSHAAARSPANRAKAREALFGDRDQAARADSARAVDKMAARWGAADVTPELSAESKRKHTRLEVDKPKHSAQSEDIARVRRACDLTQEGLAALLGVHPLTVSKWERGKASPSDWQRAMLAAFERASKRWRSSGYGSLGNQVDKWRKVDGVAMALYRLLATAYGGSLSL